MNSHGARILRTVNGRIPPNLPPQAYKSYSWRQPLRTHFHRVNCEDYGCKSYRNGWVTLVDISTELGQAQYHYLTHDKSRRHIMERIGGLISFTFPPGQEFFDGSPEHQHYRLTGYDPVMLIHGGDFRGNPRGTPTQVMRSEDWLDSFANHQEKLARAQQ